AGTENRVRDGISTPEYEPVFNDRKCSMVSDSQPVKTNRCSRAVHMLKSACVVVSVAFSSIAY
ncbi:hypothetical protein BaRGS_00034658, partial [Batillaria attramentaria]